MRTVHDLEAAFADLADTAPDAHTLTIPAEPARRPLRRTLAPAVAALATAAVIGSVLVVTLPDDRDDAPTAATMQALRPPASDGPADTTIRFTADNPTGTTSVRRYSVDRGAQQLEFLIPPGGPRCVTSGAADVVDLNCRRLASVTLMYAGRPTASDVRAFDRNEIRDRVPQDVNGAEGFFGKPGNSPVLPDLAGRTQAVNLYWQYAPGAWGEALAATRAQALALAESVRPAERAFTVPVRLTPIAHQYLNYIHAEPTPVGGGYEITSKDVKHGGAFVTWGEGDTDYDIPVVTDTQLQTVNGRRWLFGDGDDGSPRAVLQDTGVPVTISGYISMSRAAMKAVVERIRLAPDLTDRDTWFPAAELR